MPSSQQARAGSPDCAASVPSSTACDPMQSIELGLPADLRFFHLLEIPGTTSLHHRNAAAAVTHRPYGLSMIIIIII